MCRALMYMGKAILIDDLLFKTDSSLVKQSVNPQLMGEFANLAGFGIVAWNPETYAPEIPFQYKTKDLPFFDRNLKAMAVKTVAHSLVTHVRGSIYSDRAVVSQQNAHPFLYEGCSFALAHNGDLAEFKRMRYQFLQYIRPDIAEHIQGTTDSEWVYALILSQLENPYADHTSEQVVAAVLKSIDLIRFIRKENNVTMASPLNLFIASPKFLIATRFVFDYGHFIGRKNVDDLSYQSLWYTIGSQYGLDRDEYKMIEDGKRSSIIISSEPLTRDSTTWVELSEYSLLCATRKKESIILESQDII